MVLPARSFFMIRHGETAMNARRLACGGGVDSELNHEGRRQAAMARDVLGALEETARPTLIIHSGMKRTVETASILNAALGLPVHEDRDLREHMLGVFENRHWDEVYPQLREGARPEGGESLADFAERVRTVFDRALRDYAGERLLFVAHGGTFHALQRLYGQQRRAVIPNATLHRFDPEAAHSPMPWRIAMYEWRGALREGPAAICPSLPQDEA